MFAPCKLTPPERYPRLRLNKLLGIHVGQRLQQEHTAPTCLGMKYLDLVWDTLCSTK